MEVQAKASTLSSTFRFLSPLIFAANSLIGNLSCSNGDMTSQPPLLVPATGLLSAQSAAVRRSNFTFLPVEVPFLLVRFSQSSTIPGAMLLMCLD